VKSSHGCFTQLADSVFSKYEAARRRGDGLSLLGVAALAEIRSELERELVARVDEILTPLFAQRTLLAARGDRPDQDAPAELERVWPGLRTRIR
jgi:hypothetical protein